jgi:hypothetical protein
LQLGPEIIKYVAFRRTTQGILNSLRRYNADVVCFLFLESANALQTTPVFVQVAANALNYCDVNTSLSPVIQQSGGPFGGVRVTLNPTSDMGDTDDHDGHASDSVNGCIDKDGEGDVLGNSTLANESFCNQCRGPSEVNSNSCETG